MAHERRAIQVVDVAEDPAYQDDPSRRTFVELTGARTVVAVPMLKDNELIGTINVYCQEVRSFTEAQASYGVPSQFGFAFASAQPTNLVSLKVRQVKSTRHAVA